MHYLDTQNGAYLSIDELMALTGDSDATYVVSYAVSDTGRDYLTLSPVHNVRTGWEIAYDGISPERVPTQGGAHAYLQVGDRVGVWADSDGLTYVDRTVYLDGPESIALQLGRDWEQSYVWSWEDRESLSTALES